MDIKGSSSTATVDNVFLFVFAVSVVLLVCITAVMIFFVIRYSREKNPVPKNIESHMLLEIAWIVIPTVLVLSMFYFGWSGFKFMRSVPENAFQIKAVGRMWAWDFAYENGKKSGDLRVPLGRPVRVNISSLDVLHSLYIPAFRIKEDAVPGMETFLWFLPEKTGSFDLYCSEYCGVAHSSMTSKVIVMSENDFYAWYDSAEKETQKLLPGVEALLSEKGCSDCHSIDGSIEVGPSFKGLFGKKEMVITGGTEREVIVDEAYLRRSILEPGADVVKGYPDIMPSQEDNISEEEVARIISYIKMLK